MQTIIENGIVKNAETGEWVGIELPISSLPELNVARLAIFESMTYERDLNIRLKVTIRHIYPVDHENESFRGRSVLEVQQEQWLAGNISESRFQTYVRQFQDVTVERMTAGVFIDPKTGARRTAEGEPITPANTPGAVSERQFLETYPDALLARMGVDKSLPTGQRNIQFIRGMIMDLDQRGAF